MKKIENIHIILTIVLLMTITIFIGYKNMKGIVINRVNLNQNEEIKLRATGNNLAIYEINNFKKGDYGIDIILEEYENGKFKKSESILETCISDVNNNSNFKLAINKNNKDEIIIDVSNKDSKSSVSATTPNINLQEYNKSNNGFSWNMLETNNKEQKLTENRKFAIASFSIDKDSKLDFIDLGNKFTKISGNNLVDLIFYLKIKKI
ncbi:Uncharacterised protein [[Clostridium] sordellii]|uniref:hypothetical protein n=1 Tax=Paraclostridium sordellii TaxID=1505 RepID=UPI0005DC92A6|nr:hypothetical protein [Paeniclostridium sordellii]CEQ10649.1 Uncharacterised protein [[Clostridium] sordellii] [Paeniclostridium sordellii]